MFSSLRKRINKDKVNIIQSKVKINSELPNELKNARPPSNIMIKARNISTSNDMYSGAKRNKPCPCGSEKKYKFCHGA